MGDRGASLRELAVRTTADPHVSSADSDRLAQQQPNARDVPGAGDKRHAVGHRHVYTGERVAIRRRDDRSQVLGCGPGATHLLQFQRHRCASAAA